MADTIFRKIIDGEIPCHKVYEDDYVLAFLDINPLSKGHTLVIPKEPAETLDQLSDESASAIGWVLPRLCRAVLKATGVRNYNILQNNGASAHQAVFHVHFHIIPKEEAGGGARCWVEIHGFELRRRTGCRHLLFCRKIIPFSESTSFAFFASPRESQNPFSYEKNVTTLLGFAKLFIANKLQLLT